tara:strand:+ start:1226 stop:1540 length:315 start_codon:yes stop_codon:yes gene_type:complete
MTGLDDSNLKSANYDSEKAQINAELIKKKMIKLEKQIAKLNYEKCFENLEKIVKDLKTDNILLEEIQESYLKGKLYLKHCEELLEIVEQEVIELDIENLTSDID